MKNNIFKIIFIFITVLNFSFKIDLDFQSQYSNQENIPQTPIEHYEYTPSHLSYIPEPVYTPPASTFQSSITIRQYQLELENQVKKTENNDSKIDKEKINNDIIKEGFERIKKLKPDNNSNFQPEYFNAETTNFSRYKNSPCYGILGFDPNGGIDQEKRYIDCESQKTTKNTNKYLLISLILGMIILIIILIFKNSNKTQSTL